jgi:hypothetical protein
MVQRSACFAAGRGGHFGGGQTLLSQANTHDE